MGLCGWFYYDSIGSNPAFNHAWAQADWFAMALKFRARGYDFFHPATYNLLTDQGVTGAGFPVPAYLAALLMGLGNCMVPEDSGVILGSIFKARLWEKYHMAAPPQRRQLGALSSKVQKAYKS